MNQHDPSLDGLHPDDAWLYEADDSALDAFLAAPIPNPPRSRLHHASDSGNLGRRFDEREKDRNADSASEEEEEEDEEISPGQQITERMEALNVSIDNEEEEDELTQASQHLEEGFARMNAALTGNRRNPELVAQLAVLMQHTRETMETTLTASRQEMSQDSQPRERLRPRHVVAQEVNFSQAFLDQHFDQIENIRRDFEVIYAEKEAELRDNLAKIRHPANKLGRPWKRCALYAPPTSAPFSKRNVMGWLTHRFVPRGYENDPTLEWQQFCGQMALRQFYANFLPEAERTMTTKKELLVDYINHFCCRIVGDGTPYFLVRQWLPKDAYSEDGFWRLDKKGSDKAFVDMMRSFVVSLKNDEDEGGKAKPVPILDLWMKHSKCLTFIREDFNPTVYNCRMRGRKYNHLYDEQLNTYQGWAVSREMAAKYHHRLYVRMRRIDDTDEGQCVDKRPIAGWFYLQFVDRTNFVQLQKKGVDAPIGSLVTVYHTLPGAPVARGTPWKHSPHWKGKDT